MTTPNSFDELKAKIGDLIDGYAFAKKRDKDVAVNDILNLYLTHRNAEYKKLLEQQVNPTPTSGYVPVSVIENLMKEGE